MRLFALIGLREGREHPANAQCPQLIDPEDIRPQVAFQVAEKILSTLGYGAGHKITKVYDTWRLRLCFMKTGLSPVMNLPRLPVYKPQGDGEDGSSFFQPSRQFREELTA